MKQGHPTIQNNLFPGMIATHDKSHLHNGGVGAAGPGAWPAHESGVAERADESGDGGVGVVGWGEARV